ncbi:MAG: hypothetical protein ABW047_17860 [Nitrospiraceae bacterium]
MHNVTWYAQRPLDASSLNEHGIVKQVSSTDGSKESSDHVASGWRWRLSGLTLGETEHQVHEVTVRF